MDRGRGRLVTAVLLALLGAVSYGVSDFIGGLASRRTSVWPVALLSCLGSLVGAVVLALLVPGDPSAAQLWWGTLAGIGAGAGTAFLYRGLSGGRMGVVAPVSGVGATVIPVLIGVSTGERPSTLVWVGMVAALPGIWLVSREDSTAPAGGPSGLLEGLLAGIGFGVLFAALGQVPEGAGYWPLAACEVSAVLTVVVAGLALRGGMVPHAREQWWGLVSGLLAAAAGVAFLLATHHGLLSVSAVLVSLYPAFTVVLASLVLRERIHRVQAAGLALCGVAVVLVAAG
jgi:drug/metabolite transporter (DMT)-like permease